MNTSLVCMVAGAALACACNSTPSASAPDTPSSTVQVPAEQNVSPDPEPPTPSPTVAEPSPADEPRDQPPDYPDGGFGCGTFEPIKSQDPCTTASDCAPSAHCHARSCIASTKAPPPSPDIQCTMNLVCKSIDVGKCDCVDGVCALVPR